MKTRNTQNKADLVENDVIASKEVKKPFAAQKARKLLTAEKRLLLFKSLNFLIFFLVKSKWIFIVFVYCVYFFCLFYVFRYHNVSFFSRHFYHSWCIMVNGRGELSGQSPPSLLCEN